MFARYYKESVIVHSHNGTFIALCQYTGDLMNVTVEMTLTLLIYYIN